MRIVAACVLAGLVLAAAQCWISRCDPNEIDLVSYLDVADAYAAGHWSAAINGTWSPLYSWILAAGRAIARPTPAEEYPFVQVCNFLLFALALVAFEFFRRQLASWRSRQFPDALVPAHRPVSEWTDVVLAYVPFLWIALGVIGAGTASPDLLATACILWATGLLVRIMAGRRESLAFFGFGAALGLGFFSHSFVISLVPVFLAAALFSSPVRRALPRVALAAVGFVLLAGPFIAALSYERGHFTYSDAGWFNYAIHVNGVTYRHWQGDPPGHGTPLHPTRVIVADPETLEFGTPLSGTYPPWYDPAYWYEGVRLRFDPVQQVRAILRNAGAFSKMFDGTGVILLTIFTILLAGNSLPGSAGRALLRLWPVWAPAAAGLGMFVLVHMEPRYAGALLAGIFPASWGALNPRDSDRGLQLRRVAAVLAMAATLPLFGTVTRDFVEEVADASAASRNTAWAIANEMRQAGVQPGESIASVTYAQSYIARWARLARVRIVAEVNYSTHTPENYFWRQPADVKRRVLAALAATGAEVAVSDETPQGDGNDGWQAVGRTGYWIYRLASPAAATPRP